MSRQTTLRAFLVAETARFVHVHTLHRRLDDGLSLPSYYDWFQGHQHVRTTIVRVLYAGTTHVFVLYYTWSRDAFPEPSQAARRWGGVWHGELLVFRQRQVRPSGMNTLVNVRSSDTALVHIALRSFFRRARGVV
ncbi:hypothetical protein FA95DRAFT_1612568 [Auriscalpium vulgare]|uniref:Uncharacterized protein n=1 Tax=Auriscalpium vulgare TaxID=40419 RepID=A0ACB8R5P0_9AGAM|nr:hypothetical protein FA95DRAFT_1612568 [Auriscalpium vulgare]